MQFFFIIFETQQQMECIDQMMESMGSCNEGEKRKDWFNSQASGMAVARVDTGLIQYFFNTLFFQSRFRNPKC